MDFRDTAGWKLQMQMERNEHFTKHGKLPDDSKENRRELPFPELEKVVPEEAEGFGF